LFINQLRKKREISETPFAHGNGSKGQKVTHLC